MRLLQMTRIVTKQIQMNKKYIQEVLVLKSVNYLCRPHAILPDTGVSTISDYVFLMHQTDK